MAWLVRQLSKSKSMREEDAVAYPLTRPDMGYIYARLEAGILCEKVGSRGEK